MRRYEAVQKYGCDKLKEAVKQETIGLTKAEELVQWYRDKETQCYELKKILPDQSPQQVKSKPSEVQSSKQRNETVDDENDEKIQKKKKQAHTAASNTIDYLIRSDLVRLPINHPYKWEAYQRVITWLRDNYKVNKNGKKDTPRKKHKS